MAKRMEGAGRNRLYIIVGATRAYLSSVLETDLSFERVDDTPDLGHVPGVGRRPQVVREVLEGGLRCAELCRE